MNNPSGFRGKAVNVKTAKRRKISSTKWLQRQLNDPYVAKSKIDGYRSRAAYKLLEINEKFHILKPGMKVVDLGAAPGGWSQVAAKIINAATNQSSKVVAIDLLKMDSLPGVIFAQKDFYDSDAASFIKTELGGMADLVMSDMAANTTGHHATDHIRIMELCEQAFHFALSVLKPGGHFIAKIFRGGTENHLLNLVKTNFTTVKHFKPSSSRKESSEFYLIALDRKAILR
jgi:23S rRNA (uridine2552-2'-O)-methyltransferase